MKNFKYIMFDLSGTVAKMRPATLLPEYGLFEKLAGKYKLGLITGAGRSETINILKKLKILEYFEVIITADDTLYKKPDPRLIPGVEIKAYVGDTKKDEIFAKNGNVSFFRVTKKCNINDIFKYLIES